MKVYFDRTIFNDRVDQENGDCIVSSLLFQMKNFTLENISYLIEKEKIKLNNEKNPKNSLVFIIPYLRDFEVREIRKELSEIIKTYNVDFMLRNNFTDIIEVKRKVTAIEYAANEKNNLAFQFLIKHFPKYLDIKCSKYSLTEYCVLTDFIDGVKYLNKLGKINWDNSNKLLCYSKSDKMLSYLKKEYKKIFVW